MEKYTLEQIMTTFIYITSVVAVGFIVFMTHTERMANDGVIEEAIEEYAQDVFHIKVDLSPGNDPDNTIQDVH